MHLSTILDSMIHDGGTFRAEVPDSWLQGRSVYGGLQAALAVRAMRAMLPAPAPLRVLQVSFVAPLPAGPVSLRAELLREQLLRAPVAEAILQRVPLVRQDELGRTHDRKRPF